MPIIQYMQNNQLNSDEIDIFKFQNNFFFE